MVKAPRERPLLADDQPIRSRPREPRDPRQPQLPFDPMPDRIEPCLALLKPRPPVGDEWFYEVKWDGYRIAVHLNKGNVRILTRGGHDWTVKMRTLATAVEQMPVDNAWLDGEVVVLTETGIPDFNALQNAFDQHASEILSVKYDPLFEDLHGDLRFEALVQKIVGPEK